MSIIFAPGVRLKGVSLPLLFPKRLEIYNQDKLLVDPAATEQVKEFGLVLVEWFFDVAALVKVGCLNVGALMGAHITAEQIDRLKFINAHAPVPRITNNLPSSCRDISHKKRRWWFPIHLLPSVTLSAEKILISSD